MSETFVEALQLMIESSTSDINTTLPGEVVSYDPKTNRAIVKAHLPKKTADGDSIAPPQIVSVPVMWPTSGMKDKQAAITLPIAPGDGVMLSFSQRSIENWLSGNNDAPDDPRQFDLSDCIATPGLNTAGVEGNGTDLIMRMDKIVLTMKPDNSFSLVNENCTISANADGDMIMTGKTMRLEMSDSVTIIAPDVSINP